MAIRTEPVTINIGPQHPSTHGVLRLRVTFDGEVIVDIEPVFGYLHRGSEKLAEERNYVQVLDAYGPAGLRGVHDQQPGLLSGGGEDVGGGGPAARPVSAGAGGRASEDGQPSGGGGLLPSGPGSAGNPPHVLFPLSGEDSGPVRDAVRGANHRQLHAPGRGVQRRAPPDFWPALDELVLEAPHLLQELEQLMMKNEILLVRTKNVGVLSAESAIANSVSGPVLRASGVAWDWRKMDPYDIYDRLEFDVPVGERGDNYDRFRVRIEEVKQSLRMVKQCAEEIRPGPVRAGIDVPPARLTLDRGETKRPLAEGPVRTQLPFVLRPPAGAEAYGRVEAPKGELAFYLVSDGSIAPYRCKIRSPSLINLTVIRELMVGWKLADMIVTLGRH